MGNFLKILNVFLAGIVVGASMVLIVVTKQRAEKPQSKPEVSIGSSAITGSAQGATAGSSSSANPTNSNSTSSRAGDIGPLIYENPRVHQELNEIDGAYSKLRIDPATCANYSELKTLWARYLRLPINSTTGDKMYLSVEAYKNAGCK
jgi:hypothetical protein